MRDHSNPRQKKSRAILTALLVQAFFSASGFAADPVEVLGNPFSIGGLGSGENIWFPRNGAVIVLSPEQAANMGLNAWALQNQYPGTVVAHHGFRPKLTPTLSPYLNSPQAQQGLFVLSCPYGAKPGSGPGAPYAQKLGINVMSPRSATGSEVISTITMFDSETGLPVEVLKVSTIQPKSLWPWAPKKPDIPLALGDSYGDFLPNGSVLPIPNPETRFGPQVVLAGSDGARFGTGPGRSSPSSGSCHSRWSLSSPPPSVRGRLPLPRLGPLGPVAGAGADGVYQMFSDGVTGDVKNLAAYITAYDELKDRGDRQGMAILAGQAASWGYDLSDPNIRDQWADQNQSWTHFVASPLQSFFGSGHTPESYLDYMDPYAKDRLIDSVNDQKN